MATEEETQFGVRGRAVNGDRMLHTSPRDDDDLNSKVMEICVYMRDQTVLHICLEDGQFAKAEDLEEIVMEQQTLQDARKVFKLWLVSPLLELRLKSHHKPFDLVTQWDQICEKYSNARPEHNSMDEPMLYFQRNVFYQKEEEMLISDRRILMYLYHEAKFNLLEGRYIVSLEDYDRLAALQALIHLRHYDSKSHFSSVYRAHIEQFYPDFLCKKRFSLFSRQSDAPEAPAEERLERAHQRISDQYQGQDVDLILGQLCKQYLQICWKYPFYGSVFFTGQIARPRVKFQFLRGNSDILVHVAINTEGLCVMDREKNLVLLSVPFEKLSWQYREENGSDPDSLPTLYLQFPSSGGNTKLLEIYSKQAKLMDALIESCVNIKSKHLQNRAMDITEHPRSRDDVDSGDPFQNVMCKFDKMCLGTFSSTGVKQD